ncbi:transcription factor GTE11 [Morus notabilis]|nr:transcription factor GTE11 [Morus notabilis]
MNYEQCKSELGEKAMMMNEGVKSLCHGVLEDMINFRCGWHPMDFRTVKSKLDNDSYSTVDRFADDLRLTFSKAIRNNPPSHLNHRIAKEMKQVFDYEMKLLRRTYSVIDWSTKKRKREPDSGALMDDDKDQKEKDSCCAKKVMSSSGIVITGVDKKGLGRRASEAVGAESESPKRSVLRSTKKFEAGDDDDDKKVNNDVKADGDQVQPISAEKALRIEAQKRRFAETILRAEQKMVECKKDPDCCRRYDSSAETQKGCFAELILRAKQKMVECKKDRRPYEKERERARMALLQMEKSVEIDQNQETERELERLCGGPFDSFGSFLNPDSYVFEEDEDDLLWITEDLEEGEILQC